MNQYLKTYKITLTTIGPVFIGSGRTISKKEYVILKNNEVGILDIEKLYQQLKKKNLDTEFENYLLGNTRPNMSFWLRQQNLTNEEMKQCINYTISYAEKGKQNFEIKEFIKDAYQMPYIPGSSLKGMLRTILLSSDILQNKEKYQSKAKSLKSDVFNSTREVTLDRNIKEIETLRYNTLKRNEKQITNSVNDIMSGFIVSDSEPLQISDLVLCRKVEQHASGKVTPFILLRECIKPETKITFNLTIDTSICNITMEEIQNAVALFSKQYYENFVKAFPNTKPLEKDNVLLGGGVGFVSKTILYPMLGKEDGLKVTQSLFLKKRSCKKHKHEDDRKLGVSPHILKCTKYKGKMLQMGLCKFEIQ